MVIRTVSEVKRYPTCHLYDLAAQYDEDYVNLWQRRALWEYMEECNRIARWMSKRVAERGVAWIGMDLDGFEK